MRRYLLATNLLLAAAATVACGIPEEQHQATLDELKKVKATLAATRKSCREDTDRLTQQNEELNQQNSMMKSKLASLGQDLSKIKIDVSQKEQQIADLLRQQEAARKRAAMFRALVAKFRSMIDSGQLSVSVRNGRMIVKMSDKILFDPGKDKIKSDGEQALVEVTRILAGIPDRAFQVAGHTDNVPIRSRRFKSNWELSAARAVNVVKFMAENGMDPKRLSASGYSEYDPVGDNSIDEGKALNRRIEITLMPSIEELPTYSDQ